MAYAFAISLDKRLSDIWGAFTIAVTVALIIMTFALWRLDWLAEAKRALCGGQQQQQ